MQAWPLLKSELSAQQGDPAPMAAQNAVQNAAQNAAQNQNKLTTQDLSALEPLLSGSGLLDHFHLPKSVVRFLRRYQLQIWAAIISITVITVACLSYSSYKTYHNSKAAEALENAMAASVDQQELMLLEVLAQYEKTPAAALAAIALAGVKEAAGETNQAIVWLEDARIRLGNNTSLEPMLLGKLAVLYEDNQEYDKALALYGELSGMEKFAAKANAAMGRICEQTGKTGEAIAHYKKYLESARSDVPGQANANALQRNVIQFRLAQLQKQ